MKRWLLALLPALWLAGCGGGSSSTGPGWLHAAWHAEQSVAWRGELHLAAAGTVATVQVEADGEGRQRRTHLDGPCRGLQVITYGADEWRRQGDGPWSHRALPAEAGLAGAERDLQRIAANYRLTVRRTSDPTNGACVRLDLSPRRSGNPSRRFWLDAATGQVLRSEQRNHRGKLIAQTQVGQRDLTARPTIVPPAASAELHAYPLADLVPTAEPMPLPSWLPAGYRLAATYARTARSGRQRPVATFSDGLNVVTLFDRGFGRGRQGRGGGQGQCLAQSGDQANVVTLARPEREWVVIGDLPEGQLRRVVKSIP